MSSHGCAGKDGAIRHVMSGVNPQGCQVFSFKHPTEAELEHDFLWCTSRFLPERGRIGIFNRSYYEEVLIVRVHPEILSTQQLPLGLAGKKPSEGSPITPLWTWRVICIATAHASSSFSFISPEKSSASAFWTASTNRKKNWKLSRGDIGERKFWPQYMHAYEECLNATSTKTAPWYVVSPDNKENARLMSGRPVFLTA
ncbi:MAG: hypothetical protein Q9M30_03785 [Mariprofundaceae bacterium]|nr:hypothetical protein [Mariprofundaceae bacterium]